MALRDPVAVYIARSNLEAQLVRNALTNAGVEAFVTEDLLCLPGGLPRVWVEKAVVGQAKSILVECNPGVPGREESATEGCLDLEIATVCEECGGATIFALDRVGTVQACGHCGAFVDVEADFVL